MIFGQAVLNLLRRVVTYRDGSWHWRRLSVVSLLPVLISLTAAYKSELMIAHWYGTAKTLIEIATGLLAMTVGRDPKP